MLGKTMSYPKSFSEDEMQNAIAYERLKAKSYECGYGKSGGGLSTLISPAFSADQTNKEKARIRQFTPASEYLPRFRFNA